MMPDRLPTFQEAAVMNQRKRVEEVVKAIFFHFNKHNLNPLEIAYVLGSCYQIVLHQLPAEEKALFAGHFLKLVDATGTGKPKEITPDTGTPGVETE
jgi:hypothetical protein